MKIAIVKYNAGNIQSVLYALERLGVTPVYTDDPVELISADKVLFPGQGEASTTMKYLKERGLDKVIKSLTQPVFGICVGQQLLCSHSEEGDVDCLGVIPAQVKRFPPAGKIPQMGWNTLTQLQSPLMKGIPEDSYVYFVHSYYVEVTPYAIATTDYIVPFASALQKDNFYAVQFHPEKSSTIGERIIQNFLDL
ncbi:MAG: imidazole glycerol phosphate synthase subunit HisH [Cytophagaceae bacterium]|jgi:glutamine amidotransferase|nr:imidazole glycerol phosphate synthase subunit HisH [Cytophagaceae bacterium]